MSDNNNNDGNKAQTQPPQDREGSNNDNNNGSTNGTINTKKILQDLKADQEQFYSRIAKIAQSEIAASPPFNQQFEKILQNSAKRIAEIDEELKKLEEKQGDQKQATTTTTTTWLCQMAGSIFRRVVILFLPLNLTVSEYKTVIYLMLDQRLDFQYDYYCHL